MLLRSSPTSPFARKVQVAAAMLGLTDRIHVEVADTNDPNEALRQQNPLGKIPVLILEDGTALYDSSVIIEYLDSLAGGGRLIPAGPARFAALTQQALADGVAEAAVLQVYEARWRGAERQDQAWLAHQAGKVARALAHAETALSEPATALHVGHVAQACALSYLDLRFAGAWRNSHPRLVAWLDDFALRVPAFGITAAQG
jgi:glutathione S-transferase